MVTTRRQALTLCATRALLSLLFVPPLQAQTDGAIRGRVVAADGAALPQAAVSLSSASSGTSIAAETDAAGAFTFPKVTPGEYVLSASRDGFGVGRLQIVVEPRE